MQFGLCNRVNARVVRGFAALASVGMAVACASAASAPQGGQQKSGSTTSSRTIQKTIIDGKEVQTGGDLSTQTAPRSGRDTDLKWSDDHGSGTIKAKEVELTGGLDDVKLIREGGYLAVEETSGKTTRRFRAEPAKDGKLKRAYSVNGEEREFDADAKKWLSGILHRFFGDSGQRKP